MRGAMMRHLWVKEHQRFARMATPIDDGTYRLDMTADAANHAVFAFGALAADHPAVLSEMQAIRNILRVQTEVGGIARYERDPYQQIEREDMVKVPGNPWVICTLWLAQHAIAAAKSVKDLEIALEYLQWTNRRAMTSGVLAEQFNPHTGEPISVSPLTWSHATVMTTVMQYLLKHAELTGGRSGVVAELVKADIAQQA